MSIQVFDVMRQAARLGASDIHIVPEHVIMVRVAGQLIPYPDSSSISAQECGTLIYQLLNDNQRQRFEREGMLDFSIELDTIRYRGSIFSQRSGLEAVLRVIPNEIPYPEKLELPPIVTGLAERMSGLVLMTGPTGSGKTTTLACLINLINEKRRANVITIEDPIEFVHKNKNSVISQREVGLNTPSFYAALKYVLRQDPDIVMIGEMRDHETIASALTIAETGHLVFGTLHTVDAAQSIDRIIDVFPANQHQQVRSQLAGTLEAVIAQQLVPTKEGKGRVAAREVMVVTPGISNLIRQGKTHEIYSAIEMGANAGMISMDRSLADLVRRGLISEHEAMKRVTNPEGPLARLFRVV